MKTRTARPPLLGSLEARELLRAGTVVGVRKEFAGAVTRSDDPAGPIVWTLSDASKDRYGDVVSTDGHQLENFQRNPVLLWAHDYNAPPVGRLSKVGVVGEGESARLQGTMAADDWVPREVQPFAWSVEQMVRLGFLNAVSIGFLPEEFTYNDDWSMNFKRQELLEVSVVPVPANANALAEARSKGLWSKDFDRWLERVIDEKKPGAPLEIARSVWSVVRPTSVQVPLEQDTDEPGDDLAEVRELTEAVRENTAVQREVLAELRERTAREKSKAEALARQMALGRAARKAASVVADTLKKV